MAPIPLLIDPRTAIVLHHQGITADPAQPYAYHMSGIEGRTAVIAVGHQEGRPPVENTDARDGRTGPNDSNVRSEIGGGAAISFVEHRL